VLSLHGEAPSSLQRHTAQDSSEQWPLEEAATAQQILSILDQTGNIPLSPELAAAQPVRHPVRSSSPSEIKAGLYGLASAASRMQTNVERVTVHPSARLVFHTDPDGLAADRLRLLRLRLRELWAKGSLKKLLITSPLPRDGKSTVALNLATALAESGKRSVLLIEADLHHRSLAPLLGLEPQPGLSDCLQDNFDPFHAIRKLDPLGWNLLAAGRPTDHPTELLQTDRLSQLVETLSDAFDWILFDSPPVVGITDSLLVAQHTDAALLVARAGSTPRKALEDSMSLIGRKHVLGIVLNGVGGLDNTYSKYRHYYSRGNSSPAVSSETLKISPER
jgi:capsular exopolysaccharide synthesis family protein